jgi:hypothetical protein
MPTTDKANLRQLLRDECLPTVAERAPYFSLVQVRAWLRDHYLAFAPALLREYLSGFMLDGIIHNAGRGWYSRLASPFTLNREPVSGLAEDLSRAFPLVGFSCWSTEQIKEAMHHLLSQFVTFVDVEVDAMETVWNHLREAGWDAWLNPRGQDAARFAVRERTLVVRRESRKSPSTEHIAPVEKLLVELCFEARDLQLMAMSDYHAMLANLAGTKRIQMATMLKYAGDRKLQPEALLGDPNPLTPPFEKRRR